MIFSVPNIISYFRIIAAPFFLYFFTADDKILVLISVPLFILAAISDWMDGWYARRYNLESKWGLFIDPLADKILNSTALVAFVFEDIIPFWMVLVIILRDVFITFLRLFADSHGMEIKTRYIAKVKTVLQFFIIIFILMTYFFSYLLELPDILLFVYSSYIYYFMLFLTIFTLWTVIDYINENRRVVEKLFGYRK